MATQSQTFAKHTRWDPLFHFFIVPVMLITLIAIGVNFVRFPSLRGGWLVIVAIAATVATIKMRMYALRVQDRVIRLEERIRLMSVLQEPLRSRIGELQGTQFVALRFASDHELAALVERALNQKLSRADIKRAIVQWRPDHSRV
jgi:hypothetical protein